MWEMQSQNHKPGPTTKGCCKVDPKGRLESEVGMELGSEEPIDNREFVRMAERGAAKSRNKRQNNIIWPTLRR